MKILSMRRVGRDCKWAWAISSGVMAAACGGGVESTGASAAAADAERTAKAMAVAATVPDTAPPVVFNTSGSPRPGDVISVQGENFGSSPSVYLESAPTVALEIVNRLGSGWLAVRLPSVAANVGMVLRVKNSLGTSSGVKLNAAIPMHLETLQIMPGGKARLFGRNLRLGSLAPVLKINGALVDVDLANSNEHVLSFTVPPQLVASRGAVITVDNGNGTGPATLDRTVTILRGPGEDPFGIGTSWGIAFAPLTSNIVNVACQNVADDKWAIRDAMLQARNAGGGIVQLAEGTCMLEGAIDLYSKVVLQGAGKSKTTIRFTGNYPLYAEKLDLIGVRHLTLERVAGAGDEAPLLKQNTRLVIQNVAFHLGTSRQMYLDANKQIAIVGSDIKQTLGVGSQGPFTLDDSSSLVFENNKVQWASGAPSFPRVHDAVIAGNTFTRDASDQNTPGFVHSLTLDFAYRVAVLGNTFNVSGGPLTNLTRNDGESILTEGGSSSRTENVGTVTGATATTLTDAGNSLNVNPFGAGTLAENYGVAIVAGKGAGQSRRVTAYNATNKALTVDRAWDSVPDSTSKYASFVWGLEKSLVKGNVFSDNPRGIWLYGTSIRDVDLLDNTFTQGGGIYLRSFQDIAARRFTVIYNVLIARNSISNTSGRWMSYINSLFVTKDASPFGIAHLGVAIRDNQLTTNSPNVASTTEEYANVEGLMNMMRMETGSAYQAASASPLLGTVMAGNRCTNCDVMFCLGTGAGGTTLIESNLIGTGRQLDDWETGKTGERSLGTVVQ